MDGADGGGPTRTTAFPGSQGSMWATFLGEAVRRHVSDLAIVALTLLFTLAVAFAGVVVLRGT
ncbi:MAG: hypothetical protein ACTHMS_24170 [Jatrophihabitans sp.]|uniref:hypothetical protein n=1 Tax=Jatrophihabitans sp. TaxID=1932789 RepID=UPI003F7F03E7